MADTKSLLDEYGVIHDAQSSLPDSRHRLQFLAALAELESADAHRMRHFPVTRLHKITGVKQAIYRADVDKMSGWRIHIQYAAGTIHLKDLVSGARHDTVIETIKSKRHRYM